MKVNEMKNSLIEHKLTVLRDKKTGTKEFRELVNEISTFICYEALKDVKLDEVEIDTPVTKLKARRLNEEKFVFLPILRAGMGMVDGILSVVPNARIGHVGMYRNEETFKPVTYFFKVPQNIGEAEVVLLDPMLATGGSASDAIDLIKEKGVKKIKFLCIIAAPEGVKLINEKHPDVEIFCGKVDEYLNEKKYIVPGLGDAGDRIYGIK